MFTTQASSIFRDIIASARIDFASLRSKLCNHDSLFLLQSFPLLSHNIITEQSVPVILPITPFRNHNLPRHKMPRKRVDKKSGHTKSKPKQTPAAQKLRAKGNKKSVIHRWKEQHPKKWKTPKKVHGKYRDWYYHVFGVTYPNPPKNLRCRNRPLSQASEIELDEAISSVLSLQHQLANLQVAVLEGAPAREEIDNQRVGEIELDEAILHLLSLQHQLANLQVAVLEGAPAREEIDNQRVAAQGKEVARTEAAGSDYVEA